MDVRISSGTEPDELAVRNMLVTYLNELAGWDPGFVLNDVGLPVWSEFGLPGPRTPVEAARHNWWIRDTCDRLVIREGEAAVGFSIVASPPEHLDEPFDHEFVDFHVAPKARRQGAGRFAVEHILAGRPGSWARFTLAGTTGAHAFWRRVLTTPWISDLEERDGATEFRFRSGSPSGPKFTHRSGGVPLPPSTWISPASGRSVRRASSGASASRGAHRTMLAM